LRSGRSTANWPTLRLGEHGEPLERGWDCLAPVDPGGLHVADLRLDLHHLGDCLKHGSLGHPLRFEVYARALRLRAHEIRANCFAFSSRPPRRGAEHFHDRRIDERLRLRGFSLCRSSASQAHLLEGKPLLAPADEELNHAVTSGPTAPKMPVTIS
jgi:hypothetical protein